jgi:hypothetical protein
VVSRYQNQYSIPNKIFLFRILEYDIRYINAFVCVIWINKLYIMNLKYLIHLKPNTRRGVGYNLWVTNINYICLINKMEVLLKLGIQK